MSEVRLRAMTTGEFDAWVPAAIEEYAGDHMRMWSMPADTALDLATKQFAELLPDGVDTADHFIFIGEADGPPDSRVGILWLFIPSDGKSSAFVYDVAVEPSARGKGYGRGLMLAAEEFAAAKGATAIRLHVFGDNSVARALYDSLGYEATNISMLKPLT
jgi:ribosomal protein S18 acetylase RimI-like enzyme